jgi:glycosidase
MRIFTPERFRNIRYKFQPATANSSQEEIATATRGLMKLAQQLRDGKFVENHWLPRFLSFAEDHGYLDYDDEGKPVLGKLGKTAIS